MGHYPRIGDAGPDTRDALPSEPLFNQKDYTYAERIHARASDPDVKADFGAIINTFANGDLEALRGISSDREWRLFHCEGQPSGGDQLPEDLERRITATTLMGQKGLAILRTSGGEMAQACVLRYGPVLNHGHLDDLNINYFALGLELTYDLGYGLGSTHTQVGWAKKTASHQLVLVDETSQQPDPTVDDSGGSLHLFAGMPGMQVVDADADNVYRSLGVTTYRRCLALVGNGPGSYLLDIFNVEGGKQHDYLAHALSDDIQFDGVELGQRGEGSVAGPGYDWGERQLNDGDMSGEPGKPYWSPPPGNGLGFLMHPRNGAPTGPWSATWGLPGDTRSLRMTALLEPGTEVINAWAPGIYPTYPKAEHVVVRRRSDAGPLSSTFVTVREPFGRPPGGSVQTAVSPAIGRVERTPAGEGATALAVHFAGGPIDRFVYAGTPARRVKGGDVEIQGCFGCLRIGVGWAREAYVVGKSIQTPELKLELQRGSYTGKVVGVDYDQNRVTVNTNLPTDGRLDLETVQFGNPLYSRNTTYTIHGINRSADGSCVIDLGPQRMILGRGTLHADPTSATEMTSLTPHDYANGLTRRGVDFFNGKVLVSDDRDVQTRIESMVSSPRSAELVVESTEGFAAGDRFTYLDVSEGDDFIIYNWAVLKRDRAGEIRVTATDDVTLTMGSKMQYIPWAGGAGAGDLGSSDFDGSGHVDFQDFVLFAKAFGSTTADAGFDARFDLNGDGGVNFTDFVHFANAFGRRPVA